MSQNEITKSLELLEKDWDIDPIIKDFHLGKRDDVCHENNLKISDMSRGLVSLVQKGVIIKENNMYSIHYRIIPYMRVKADCDYASAINETRMK